MKLARMAGTALLSSLVVVTQAHAGLSRDDVRDALAAARRTGDIMASGDSGQTLRERYPGRYAKTAPLQAERILASQ